MKAERMAKTLKVQTDRKVFYKVSRTFPVRDIQDALIANVIPYIDFYLSPN